MALGAAKTIEQVQIPGARQGIPLREKLLDRWLEHTGSWILHHEDACCDQARRWFLAYSRSMEIGASNDYEIKAPTWLSKLFTWGPSEWPISWCELVKEKVLDCGVFAALAREVFTSQGHVAHPAQILLSYGEECTRHWRSLWSMKESDIDSGKVFPWIGEEIVYHEVCVLELPNGEARLYDSTWGNWLLPHQRVGHGAVLAVRTECPRLLSWAGKTMSYGEWIEP